MFDHFLSRVWACTSCSYAIIVCMNIILLLHNVISLSYFAYAFYETSWRARRMRVLDLFNVWVMGMTYIIASTALYLLMLMRLELKVMTYTVVAIVVLRNWCSYGNVICLMWWWLLMIFAIEHRLKMSLSSRRALIFGLNCSIEFTLSWLEESSFRNLNLVVSVSLIDGTLVWDYWILLNFRVGRCFTKADWFSGLLYF